MAKPEITSIEPSIGPTSGRSLIEIVGSGFRTTLRRHVGSNTGALPAVAVELGEVPALRIAVLSDGRIQAILPPHEPAVVEVVVRNLDDAGQPIPGEEATAPGGFTYVRPSLTDESDLARAIRTLIRHIKRDVIDNVTLTVQTDYADDLDIQLALTHIASLPALILVGPDIRENRFYSINQRPEQAAGSDGFVQRRAPYTVDLGFTIVGVSDHTVELLNLLASTQLFFHVNDYLRVDPDPANPAAGQVAYELALEPAGELKVSTQPNSSNIRNFSGSFVVRGVDIERYAGLPDSDVLDRGRQASTVSLPTPAPLRAGPSNP